jgi:hypothetical protein
MKRQTLFSILNVETPHGLGEASVSVTDILINTLSGYAAFRIAIIIFHRGSLVLSNSASNWVRMNNHIRYT